MTKKSITTALMLALGLAAIATQAAVLALPQVRPMATIQLPAFYQGLPKHRMATQQISSELDRYLLVDAQV